MNYFIIQYITIMNKYGNNQYTIQKYTKLTQNKMN